MRTGQFTLTSKDVQAHAIQLIQKNLKLADYSRKCTAHVLLAIVFAAAARLTSMAAACQRLAEGPSDETLRKALLATLPDYLALQKAINRALAGCLPKALRRRRQRLAIDLHLAPYYGKPFADAKEIYRSQAKKGTNHFHAYATVYVVRYGQRYTVALTPVERGEDMKAVLQRLLKQAAQAGVRPCLLLLDRGFYSVAVIRYLQQARVPFLMPAIARGRLPAQGKPATGIRALQRWKKSGWAEHTLKAGPRTATVSICVFCGNYRGQWKRRGRFAWVYAFWGFEPGSPRWVADTYRLRFGIESSYRQLNEARVKTCTRSPVVRLFLMAVALILRNIWVWLHWEFLSTPRRGGRRIRLERLRFKTLLNWLEHVVVSLIGFADLTLTDRPCNLGVTAFHAA